MFVQVTYMCVLKCVCACVIHTCIAFACSRLAANGINTKCFFFSVRMPAIHILMHGQMQVGLGPASAAQGYCNFERNKDATAARSGDAPESSGCPRWLSTDRRAEAG